MKDDEALVRMSRQIADFFAAYDEQEAVDGIVGHMRGFWAPAMRARLVTIYQREPQLLHPLVRAAARELAQA